MREVPLCGPVVSVIPYAFIKGMFMDKKYLRMAGSKGAAPKANYLVSETPIAVLTLSKTITVGFSEYSNISYTTSGI